jgi:hypothetical protein
LPDFKIKPPNTKCVGWFCFEILIVCNRVIDYPA